MPYEIAVVRAAAPNFAGRTRSGAARPAHFNTELIPQDLIYVDLCTDSGVSSPDPRQLAALAAANSVEPGMGLAAEGSRAFARLAETGTAYFRLCLTLSRLRRGARRSGSGLRSILNPTTFVAGNLLFPSTRIHIEMNGAKIIDVIGDAAHDLTADEPFKGNVDVEKLEHAIEEKGAEQMSCIYVELSVNGAVAGIRCRWRISEKLKGIAAARKIPLFLDACRILENSFLIKTTRGRLSGAHRPLRSCAKPVISRTDVR